MSALTQRRGFLRGLATLPMLSVGAVAAPAKSDLARACEFAVEHGHWIDRTAILEHWSDDRVGEECDRCNDVFDRALAEPSQDRVDLVAKVRLCLDDRERHCPEPECDTGERMVYVVLREVIALCA